MKTLLLALPLLLIAIGCNNKDAGTEFKQQKEEINKEYQENVNEAKEQRQDDLNSAREDLKEQQKEEASDYVDESDSARIKSGSEVEVQESQDQ